MLCIKCGTSLPESARFCFKCGEKIEAENINSSETETVLLPKSAVTAKSSETETVLLPKSAVTAKSSETETVLLPKSAVTAKSSETETVLLPKSAVTAKSSETETVLLPKSPTAEKPSEAETVFIPKATATNAETEKQIQKGSVSKTVRKRKSNKIIIIAIVVAVILIVAGIFASGILFGGDKANIERAQRYLAEEQYELAATEFDKIIISYPMNENGYLGRAEVYTAQGKNKEAIEVLETGFRKTNSDKIWEKLSELKKRQNKEAD